MVHLKSSMNGLLRRWTNPLSRMASHCPSIWSFSRIVLNSIQNEENAMMASIKPKERDSVVQALRAGVVPRQGLRHVQVGRAREVEQVIKDVERIGGGGS